MHSLSDELVVMVAEHLNGFFSLAKFVGFHYRDLLNFCLVSKQFARCGQEAMIRHVCITYPAVEPLRKLHRTLQERPELLEKIRGYKSSVITEVGLTENYDPPKVESVPRQKRWKRLLKAKLARSFMMHGRSNVHAAPQSLDTSQHPQPATVWAGQTLDVPEPICCHVSLAILAKNLSFLVLEVESGLLDKLTSHMYDVATASWSSATFTNLSNVKITSLDRSLDVDFQMRNLLTLPNLKKLELGYPPQSPLNGFHREDGIVQIMNRDEHRTSALEELILNGWCNMIQLSSIFRRVQALRSLTYRPYSTCTGPPSRELNPIWDHLLHLKDTLERLDLEFVAASGTYFQIWPRNMTHYPHLTHFSLTGRFAWGDFGGIGTVDFINFLPPNLQEHVWAHDRSWSLGKVPIRPERIEFARNLHRERPAMRVFTVTRDAWKEDDKLFVEDLLHRGGVELREWTVEEQRAFVERCDAFMKDPLFLFNIDGSQRDRSYVTTFPKNIHPTLAPGESLNAMNRIMIQNIAKSADALAAPSPRRIKVGRWLRYEVILATTNSVYGPGNPLLDPDVENAFWYVKRPRRPLPGAGNTAFDENLLGFVVNVLPSVTARKCTKARADLGKAFRHYFDQNEHLNGSVLVQARYNHSHEYNVSVPDIAASESAYIYSHEEVLKDCRDELATITTTSTAEEGTTIHSIDMISIKSSCLDITATLQEVMRHTSVGSSVSHVTEDTMIDGYRLKKGTPLSCLSISCILAPTHGKQTQAESTTDDS
ncbi:hypothetical protein K458DRAFT_395607 [Lentithecium fluviatile CBS 122367]|uniref:Uncharacterized protein n=1 Tax=Lentithecium fluviatile CBS 122367 TaxID=1168545 RepID=A0A6G1III6_9PLEO|nr:hypothetical protein K458DRAFT_395607 [Lentithecium fluviatile CBS 122367]